MIFGCVIDVRTPKTNSRMHLKERPYMVIWHLVHLVRLVQTKWTKWNMWTKWTKWTKLHMHFFSASEHPLLNWTQWTKWTKWLMQLSCPECAYLDLHHNHRHHRHHCHRHPNNHLPLGPQSDVQAPHPFFVGAFPFRVGSKQSPQ